MNDDYGQPDFYHFSRDSVDLAQCAFEYLRKSPRQSFRLIDEVIDLCCGCGIVGIEFLKSFQNEFDHFKKINYIEKNAEFEPFIRQNILNHCEFPHNIFIKEIGDTKIEKAYIILSNPPYYIKGRGRLPKNRSKANCHFWENESFISWFDALRANKEYGGISFFSYRKDGFRIDDLKKELDLQRIHTLGNSDIFVSFPKL